MLVCLCCTFFSAQFGFINLNPTVNTGWNIVTGSWAVIGQTSARKIAALGWWMFFGLYFWVHTLLRCCSSLVTFFKSCLWGLNKKCTHPNRKRQIKKEKKRQNKRRIRSYGRLNATTQSDRLNLIIPWWLFTLSRSCRICLVSGIHRHRSARLSTKLTNQVIRS